MLTDTGAFHYSNITPRTFEICRECTVAGVNPPAIASAVYDSNRIGRLKIFGAVLAGMQLDPTERIATLTVTRQVAADCGATYDDTEGLINFPLSARDVLASVFFKENGLDDWRVSLRSKGDIDVNAVAKEFGGGGHKNASGCGVRGTFEQWKPVSNRKSQLPSNRSRRVAESRSLRPLTRSSPRLRVSAARLHAEMAFSSSTSRRA